MKRTTYVDSEGKVVNQDLEHKRPILKLFFCIGTIIPVILIIMIIVTMVQNKTCNDVYKNIRKATQNYLKDFEELPKIEGEETNVNISDLYSAHYLSSNQTQNLLCSGHVKVTKYKNEYIYTPDVRNCNKCSVNIKYKGWSKELNYFPKNKSIVDVIPYYNYYDRQVNATKWTNYFTEDEISDEESEYGNYLPLDEEKLPVPPNEANIFEIQSEDKTQYRYRDKTWKWYDIVGNYSEFSSEKPAGYANKDENTQIYTDWSNYTLDYPEEKSYREIQQITGKKFYYTNKKGEKIYYNNGQYSNPEDVNRDKYTEQEQETSTMYRYRDKQWRWYNGQKRKYSYLTSNAPADKPYCDFGTESLGTASGWEDESKLNNSNSVYRFEETRVVTRYRTVYEILSLKVFDKPLNKSEFEKKVDMTVPEFSEREDVKLEITYKFKYRKS